MNVLDDLKLASEVKFSKSKKIGNYFPEEMNFLEMEMIFPKME